MIFKVGDVIRFNELNRNIVYEDGHIPYGDEFIVEEVQYNMIRFKYKNYPTISVKNNGYFDHRFELATTRSKEQIIIAKIKYLKDKYDNRRASMGLRDNNLSKR